MVGPDRTSYISLKDEEKINPAAGSYRGGVVTSGSGNGNRCGGKGLLIGLEYPSNEMGFDVSKGLFSRNIIVAGTLKNAETFRLEPALNVPYELLDRVLASLDDIFENISEK